MSYTQKLEVGRVYYLEDYTAPKVYNGLYFECLQTDQKIPAHSKVVKSGEFLTDDFPGIWKPERFFKST